MSRSMDLYILFSIFCCIFACCECRNTSEESKIGKEEESLYGTFNLILLSLIGIGVVFQFYNGNKEKNTDKTFTISSNEAPGSKSDSSSGGKSLMEKMKKSNRRMVAFFGSQTGTGEGFAIRLAKEGMRYGFGGVVIDPDDIEFEDLTELVNLEEDLDGPVLAVFFMATYGDGEPTENAQKLFEWLQEGTAYINGLHFAVFGLGNSSYEHFNVMGKIVDQKLEEMGGKRICDLGIGDDNFNIESDFLLWKDAFWTSVCKEFDLNSHDGSFSVKEYETIVLKEGDYETEKVYNGEMASIGSYHTQKPPFNEKNPFLATIKVNQNIHSDKSDRYCMHLEIGLEGSQIEYMAGDHLGIYPTNADELVNKIGLLLNVDLDTVFHMRALDNDAVKKSPFPVPTTYRNALKHYLDITVAPRTHMLMEIAEYTTDPVEKAKLLLMSSNTEEGHDVYNSFIVKDCRHITNILEDFPSCKPSIDHLLELLPRLQPRFYSISSSPKVHRDTVHVTAVVVKYKTPTGRTNNGVCTTWLQPKIPGDEIPAVHKVPVYVRKSPKFRLPSAMVTPVIMIGPGTGLAPFRGFIQERAWHKKQGKHIGEAHLYFGCRSKNEDFIYREELEKFVEDDVLFLHTAFSRDQEKKIYVTDLLCEHMDNLWFLIGSKNAHVYVCGDAKMMAKNVRKVITQALSLGGNMSTEESEKYIKKMEEQKRYCTDVWT